MAGYEQHNGWDILCKHFDDCPSEMNVTTNGEFFVIGIRDIAGFDDRWKFHRIDPDTLAEFVRAMRAYQLKIKVGGGG